MENKKDLKDGSERNTGVMRILAESRRKAGEAADQLREEIILEKYLNKLEAIRVKESGRPDTTGFVKANSPVESETQEPLNIWQWLNMPETVRVELAKNIENSIFGRFKKGFEKLEHLGQVLQQNEWLPDPEKGLARFREWSDKFLSPGKIWFGKDFGDENFKGILWLEMVNKRFEEMTKLLRWSPFAQENEGPSPDQEKESALFQKRPGELSSNSKVWSTKHFGEDDFRSPPLLDTLKERFEKMVNSLRWFPFTQEPEGQSPATVSGKNDKESPLTAKSEAGLESNSAWLGMLKPFAPTPEETPKAVLSLFSPGDIIRKDYGALFGFSNISSYFGQAERDMAKSLSKLGNRDKEETRIEMEGLKEEIKNIKLNEDKMMRSLQDLKEETKRIDSASKEGKSRPLIEADLPKDEIRDIVRGGWKAI